MKKKRTEDRKFLDSMLGSNCFICKSNETTVGHHLKTKGSGGPDLKWNLMPLCAKHHMEVHAIGLANFSNKYGQVKNFLKNNGWKKAFYDGKRYKWFHKI